jgi:hypothetical protein
MKLAAAGMSTVNAEASAQYTSASAILSQIQGIIGSY